MWVTDAADGTVSRIDPAVGAVTGMIPVGNGPAGLAFGDGSVWAGNSLDGTISRIDPATGAVTALIRVGSGPGNQPARQPAVTARRKAAAAPPWGDGWSIPR